MKAMAFDGIARELGDGATRRGFFRLLGGAAALGAGLALGNDSLAKGKRDGTSRGESDRKGDATSAGNARNQG